MHAQGDTVADCDRCDRHTVALLAPSETALRETDPGRSGTCRTSVTGWRCRRRAVWRGWTCRRAPRTRGPAACGWARSGCRSTGCPTPARRTSSRAPGCAAPGASGRRPRSAAPSCRGPARPAPAGAEGTIQILVRADCAGSVFDPLGQLTRGTLRLYEPGQDIREQFAGNTHLFTLSVQRGTAGVEQASLAEMFDQSFDLTPFQGQLLRSAVGLLLDGVGRAGFGREPGRRRPVPRRAGRAAAAHLGPQAAHRGRADGADPQPHRHDHLRAGGRPAAHAGGHRGPAQRLAAPALPRVQRPGEPGGPDPPAPPRARRRAARGAHRDRSGRADRPGVRLHLRRVLLAGVPPRVRHQPARVPLGAPRASLRRPRGSTAGRPDQVGGRPARFA